MLIDLTYAEYFFHLAHTEETLEIWECFVSLTKILKRYCESSTPKLKKKKEKRL